MSVNWSIIFLNDLFSMVCYVQMWGVITTGPLSTTHASRGTQMWCTIWWRRPTVISVSTTQPTVLFSKHPLSGETNDAGRTPLDIATRYGHTEIAGYLKSLSQPCKLTRIMSTQCGPIQLLSLYSCCDWRQWPQEWRKWTTTNKIKRWLAIINWKPSHVSHSSTSDPFSGQYIHC